MSHQVVSLPNDDEHGLIYPISLLSSLPILTPRPYPHQPIRLLPLPVFSQLHFNAQLSHCPDNIIFPFLHGLEGSNHAQNIFFATGSTRGAHGDRVVIPPAKVPRFRGLIWCICEDDLDLNLINVVSKLEVDPFEDVEDLEDDFYSSEEELDGEELERLDSRSDEFAMDVDAGFSDGEDKHMHPVQHRTPLSSQVTPTPTPGPNVTKIQINITPTATTHDRRDSNASTLSTASSSVSSTSKFTEEDDRESVSTSATSLSPSAPSSPLSESQCPPSTLTPTSVPAQIQTPNPTPKPTTTPKDSPPLLTSTFRPKDLLRSGSNGEPEFVPPRIPDGISLRNFGIQVPVYATLSDIVVYSPKGPTRAAMNLAERFKVAIEKLALERKERIQNAPECVNKQEYKEPLAYNVFVLDAKKEEMEAQIPHLMVRLQGEGAAHTDGTDGHSSTESEGVKPNTINFAAREKEEMRDLTRASEIVSLANPLPGQGATPTDYSGSMTSTHWDPTVGQIFLGNSNDVPLFPDPSPPPVFPKLKTTDMDIYEEKIDVEDPFNYLPTNDPKKGFGYDLCIECHEMAPFPSTAHLRAAEEHLVMLDTLWAERQGGGDEINIRPPPNANAIIHLPFPSSPSSTQASVASLVPFLKFLERLIHPVSPISVSPASGSQPTTNGSHGRRWSSVSSLMSSLPSTPYHGPRSRSSTSPSSPYSPSQIKRTRPMKILIYSPDGYTDSSVPALCLLMAIRGLSLPEAYLELQVQKKRSFFVYQNDLGILRRVESRLSSEREQERARTGARVIGTGSLGRQSGWPRFGSGVTSNSNARAVYHTGGRQASNSISNPSSSNLNFIPSSPQPLVTSPPQPAPMIVPSQGHLVRSRPRASTSPWLPSLFDDHQSWFNDPRFDGSFPSRVLPFLYLGNLNHAQNAYMLHALGITHVVSVGECALVPPQHDGENSGMPCERPLRIGPGPHYIPGKGPGGHGSLWIEEREGRIKVLDIKGVCDDGIDTLEPQLEPICDWIEKARKEGGQVLVHCRVGVSRSATVTIAYVMKHLSIPLVDAYLIVRSRRLSVLIQPNMRLLYNLCGWEIKLARERAGDDEQKLKNELARSLSWPYLAREVHSLNEKYLH